jgi:hypothetical protein
VHNCRGRGRIIERKESREQEREGRRRRVNLDEALP